MKALQLIALSAIAFSFAASSAEVYRTDNADFEIYGRAKVNMFNGYAYEFTTGKEAHPKLYGSAQTRRERLDGSPREQYQGIRQPHLRSLRGGLR